MERIVLPPKLQQKIMKSAHKVGHLRTTKANQMLRAKYWFLDMNEMIDQLVGLCYDLQEPINHQQKPLKEISIGFGELYPDGQHNFEVMDPRTRYPEVEVVFTTAIKPTTENLKKHLFIMAYKNKHSLTMICQLIQKNLQLLLKKNDFNTTDCDCDFDLLSTLSSPRPDVQNKTRKLLDLF